MPQKEEVVYDKNMVITEVDSVLLRPASKEGSGL